MRTTTLILAGVVALGAASTVQAQTPPPYTANGVHIRHLEIDGNVGEQNCTSGTASCIVTTTSQNIPTGYQNSALYIGSFTVSRANGVTIPVKNINVRVFDVSYDSVLGEVEWKAEITFDDGSGGNIDYVLTATLLLWNGTALTVTPQSGTCVGNSQNTCSSQVFNASTTWVPAGSDFRSVLPTRLSFRATGSEALDLTRVGFDASSAPVPVFPGFDQIPYTCDFIGLGATSGTQQNTECTLDFLVLASTGSSLSSLAGHRQRQYYNASTDWCIDPMSCPPVSTRLGVAKGLFYLALIDEDVDGAIGAMTEMRADFSQTAGLKEISSLAAGCWLPLIDIPGDQEPLDAVNDYCVPALTDCAKNSWYSSHVQVGSTSTLPTGVFPGPNPLEILDNWPIPPSSADLFVRMRMEVGATTSSDETDGTMTCQMMVLN